MCYRGQNYCLNCLGTFQDWFDIWVITTCQSIFFNFFFNSYYYYYYNILCVTEAILDCSQHCSCCLYAADFISFEGKAILIPLPVLSGVN